MGPDKKNIAAMIVAKAKNPLNKNGNEIVEADSEAVEAAGEGEEMDEGLMIAGDEIMSALKANDTKGLVEALRSLIDMCY